MSVPDIAVDRGAVIEAYARNRARSRAIFDIIDPAAYYSRPIALRNPIVFYEGHLPAFSVIAFLERGLGHPCVDARLEDLFARGIDPDSEAAAVPRSGASTRWPSRDEVLAFADACDRAVIEAIGHAPFIDDRPAMHRAQALYTALEHEAMHQETLLYMWHRLPHAQKSKPAGVRYDTDGASPAYASIRIPPGHATLGADRDVIPFGWDNEFGEHRVHVRAFEIDAHDVTNGDFLAFIEDGGYQNATWWTVADWEWLNDQNLTHPNFWVKKGREFFWKGMFEDLPLPVSWPVYVSQAEAWAYARWRERRLPTEAEFHRAAFGTPSGDEREFPWGNELPDPTRGNFDFASWEPIPAGSRPAGASAWGVHDLVGNGWEWTSTIFAPFDGFEPMASYPEYSADFFDGQHDVLKGASSATANALVRRSFRNWFRPNYPYVYATFRTAK